MVFPATLPPQGRPPGHAGNVAPARCDGKMRGLICDVEQPWRAGLAHVGEEIQRMIGEYLEILGSEKVLRNLVVKELREV